VTNRKFPPGSEWLYLKIYTGVKTADLILEEAIQPVVDDLQRNNDISKWFFIRYNDPKPHLRVRFMLSNTRVYSKTLDKINDVLSEYLESGEISNIVIDTYNRELERYGDHTSEEAESLFCTSSEFALQCLYYNDEEKIIVSLFYIDKILDKLNLSISEKLHWIKDFNDAFKHEFNADKKLNSQLDKKYREFRLKYVDFIQSEEFLEVRNTIISYLEESDAALGNMISYNENRLLNVSLQSFSQSIFHMHLNRLFVSNQRIFEMLIYDYLLRYYKMILFKPQMII